MCKPFQITVSWDGEVLEFVNQGGAHLSCAKALYLINLAVSTVDESIRKPAPPPCPVCSVCGRKLRGCRLLNKRRVGLLPVQAFVAGEEVTLDACTKKCQTNARKLFERKKLCRDQQSRELREIKGAQLAMKTLGDFTKQMMRQEASQLRREKSEPETTSRA
jgi:hypothetical protein